MCCCCVFFSSYQSQHNIIATAQYISSMNFRSHGVDRDMLKTVKIAIKYIIKGHIFDDIFAMNVCTGALNPICASFVLVHYMKTSRGQKKRRRRLGIICRCKQNNRTENTSATLFFISIFFITVCDILSFVIWPGFFSLSPIFCVRLFQPWRWLVCRSAKQIHRFL